MFTLNNFWFLLRYLHCRDYLNGSFIFWERKFYLLYTIFRFSWCNIIIYVEIPRQHAALILDVDTHMRLPDGLDLRNRRYRLRRTRRWIWYWRTWIRKRRRGIREWIRRLRIRIVDVASESRIFFHFLRASVTWCINMTKRFSLLSLKDGCVLRFEQFSTQHTIQETCGHHASPRAGYLCSVTQSIAAKRSLKLGLAKGMLFVAA